MNDVHSRIYKNLIAALGQGKDPVYWPNAWKLEKHPYQTLHVDILEHHSDGVTMALAHYYQQNGDLIPDPDMQVRLHIRHEMAEALTFQNLYIYQQVYTESDGVRLINPLLKKQLNSFLLEWSRNLKTRFSGVKPSSYEDDTLPSKAA